MNPRVCLVALVKDEEPVIRRCLKALKPYITSWVIFDTGSTDGTMQVIREVMEDLPGELLERPFEGFAKSRSDVMEVARARADSDYLLMMDADDTWTPGRDFAWPPLDADVYDVKLSMGASSWHRPQLTRTTKPWRYKGAAHEWMVCDEVTRSGGRLANVAIRCGSDGARRRKEGLKKYERIAKILEGELEADPNDLRSMFYLAQSYRDARQHEKALAMYQRRSESGGWAEEVWYSLFQIAVIRHRLGHEWDVVRAAYERAFEFRPTRAEPLVEIAAHYRKKKNHARAFLYSAAAKDIAHPVSDRLYVDESVYNWRALDEYAIAAYWAGHHQLALEANLKICAVADVTPSLVPPKHRDRVEYNLSFSLPKHEPLAPPVTRGDRVTVVVPTYRCPSPDDLLRGVRSVLEQSYENIVCVVVSDGDEVPPWDALDTLDDPRLVRYHVPENHGQFFAIDAVLRATPDTMICVQDDDDFSAPDRIQSLVASMAAKDADVVFCHVEKRLDARRVRVRYCRPSWLLQYPGMSLVHVGSHMGLFKTAALLRLGGYAGPVRLGYDTLVVDMMARLGRPAFVHRVLYHQLVRQGSMTTSPATSHQSAARGKAFGELRALAHKITVDTDPVAAARRETEVDAATAAERDRHVAVLRTLLEVADSGHDLGGGGDEVLVDDRADGHVPQRVVEA